MNRMNTDFFVPCTFLSHPIFTKFSIRNIIESVYVLLTKLSYAECFEFPVIKFFFYIVFLLTRDSKF